MTGWLCGAVPRPLAFLRAVRCEESSQAALLGRSAPGDGFSAKAVSPKARPADERTAVRRGVVRTRTCTRRAT
ncbi:hypothetical protein HPB52_010163 [Rhipicephalus sanguineus]|uniref:Uncharacterized protein n=1 Tax=Rhipicephalus sanguineus TaxID=34632 RepID=A0A9D4PWP6_RHISA|nr:hypothetical protein HPB52_010163 [Rhipicephalus sanguineus]